MIYKVFMIYKTCFLLMLKVTIILFCSNAAFLMVTQAHQQQQLQLLKILPDPLQKVQILMPLKVLRMVPVIISLRKNAVNQCTKLKKRRQKNKHTHMF